MELEFTMDQSEKDRAIRQAIHERILKRSASDIDFRRLLIDNPKSALARELGIDIPDDVHVTVLPESENHVFIVIPPLVTEPGRKDMANLDPSSPESGESDELITGIDRLALRGPQAYFPH
jgi:hypothetical protein